jgi:uncharacterized delta-60 repeat protein
MKKMKKCTWKSLLLAFVVVPMSALAQVGAIDGSFNTSGGPNDWVVNMHLQPDNKILIGGYFTTYGMSGNSRFDRINPDGSYDGGFQVLNGADQVVNALGMQSNGKIILGGEFTSMHGQPRNFIARLQSDGVLDASFNNTGTNAKIYDLVVLPNDKILIGGYFTTNNGTPAPHIDRLNSDGSVDFSFQLGSGANDFVSKIVVQSDQKILLAGNFTSYSGTAANQFVRLQENGLIDNTFNVGTGPNSGVYTMDVQADGKILVGGNFTNFGGAASPRMERLNTDGTVDFTFNIGNGFNDYITAIHVQPDGKILVSGAFTICNGVPVNRLVRLNSDGSIDPTFATGTGLGAPAFKILTQPNGKILLAGAFTSYNGTIANYFTRLGNSGLSISEEEASFGITLYPNPTFDVVRIASNLPVEHFELIDLSGKIVKTGNSENLSVVEVPRGVYWLTVKTGEHIWTEKLIIE